MFYETARAVKNDKQGSGIREKTITYAPAQIPVSMELSKYELDIISKFRHALRQMTHQIHQGLLKRRELNSETEVEPFEFDQKLKSVFSDFDYENILSISDYTKKIQAHVSVFLSNFRIKEREKVIVFFA